MTLRRFHEASHMDIEKYNYYIFDALKVCFYFAPYDKYLVIVKDTNLKMFVIMYLMGLPSIVFILNAFT